MTVKAFISYGAPDEDFATVLNEVLRNNGIETFFFPVSAEPGQRLHRMMSNEIEAADKVVCICSEGSLLRSGVLNELDHCLAREAREGASSVLIPIRLDDFVFSGWRHPNTAIIRSVRDRVIADFSNTPPVYNEVAARSIKLIEAILSDKDYILTEENVVLEFDQLSVHRAALRWTKKAIVNNARFNVMHFARMSLDGTFFVRQTVPQLFSLTRDQSVKALDVIFPGPQKIGETVVAEVVFECTDSFSSQHEHFGINALQTLRRMTFAIVPPNNQNLKSASAFLLTGGVRRDVSDRIKMENGTMNIEIAPFIAGSRLMLEWLW